MQTHLENPNVQHAKSPLLRSTYNDPKKKQKGRQAGDADMVPLALSIIWDYLNRLIHFPALSMPVINDHGHIGVVLSDSQQDEVLPCFSQLRSALSVLIVRISLALIASTGLVLIVSTSLGAMVQRWCDLTISVMGGQFDKASGKLQLKAVMPVVVPALEALMRTSGVDDTTFSKACIL